MTPQEIRKLEEIGINAFPALLTELYDGWVIRYANGYSHRGNSVNPLYDRGNDWEQKITECEQRFWSKGLECTFKMTEQTDAKLDQMLVERGYGIGKGADILIQHIEGYDVNPQDVRIGNQIEEEWLEQFVVLNETTLEPYKSTVCQMFRLIGQPVLCATIYDGEQMVACGLGVLEQDYLGLFDIRVLEAYRRRGIGSHICQKLMYEGAKAGAAKCYLQVAFGNEPAHLLYKKLGFEEAYPYWYRVKKPQK